MTKQALRTAFIKRRTSITADEAAAQSQLIARLFFGHFDVEKMRAIHTYQPLSRQNEIDTFPIIETLREQYPQVCIVVPRILPGTYEMEHYLWQPQMNQVINRWGIAEPDPSSAVSYPPADLDLVIIPLLAFDERGYRVGYGKGFYDRFLARCRPDVIKAGLSLFDPVALISDTDPYDIRMDFCLTPTRIWAW